MQVYLGFGRLHDGRGHGGPVLHAEREERQAALRVTQGEHVVLLLVRGLRGPRTQVTTVLVQVHQRPEQHLQREAVS